MPFAPWHNNEGHPYFIPFHSLYRKGYEQRRQELFAFFDGEKLIRDRLRARGATGRIIPGFKSFDWSR